MALHAFDREVDGEHNVTAGHFWNLQRLTLTHARSLSRCRDW
jgi:hypothetical protein